MASRLLAQVIVAAGSALFRAGTQAWQQALVNAQRSGVAQEAVKGAMKTGTMTLEEAQKILVVAQNAPWEQVAERYKTLMDRNEEAKSSFYIKSKIFRAYEALEADYENKGLKPKDAPPSNSGPQGPPQQVTQ